MRGDKSDYNVYTAPRDQGLEKKMRAAIWNHPSTGVSRVYFNDVPRQGSIKIFAVATDTGDWDLKFSDRPYNVSKDELSGYIDSFLRELNESKGGDGYVSSFERIIELLK